MFGKERESAYDVLEGSSVGIYMRGLGDSYGEYLAIFPRGIVLRGECIR